MPSIYYFALLQKHPMNFTYLSLSIKKAPKRNYSIGAGGDEWIRTTDSRIFSPMLYQLSYITVK